MSLIVFFVLAVAACVGFVAFCQMHPAELVTADYYEQEVRYQGQIDRLSRAKAFKGEAGINYDFRARQIRIALPAAHASGQGIAGSIHLYRPSDAGLDQRLELKTDPQGRQALDARDLSAGLWKVQVLWTNAGQEFLLDEKVVVARD